VREKAVQGEEEATRKIENKGTGVKYKEGNDMRGDEKNLQ